MTKLTSMITHSAAAAALLLSGLSLGAATTAQAQPWPHTENRCTNDACATYRCDGYSCTRISGYRYRYNDTDRGYYYERDSYRTQKCDGDRCATFNCDSDGDNCRRVSDWHWRY